ncbi:MAG: hypothetical protein EPN93_13540 [Spirochaetes bacterium]|nr:MAG: hypothetical protein EPN93_13540 [Spirochaetota bacterium]
MRHKFNHLLILVLSVLLFTSCNDENSTSSRIPKGDRLLGMDVLNTTPSIDFNAGITKVKAAGVQFITFPVLWSDINATGATYDATWVQNIKNMAVVCSANGLKLSLTIWTVDTTGKHLPSDLMTTRFNDITMANRFIDLLEKLFITESIDYALLTSIQIGNEIDGYNVAGDSYFSWSDYAAFLYNVKLLIAAKPYSSLKTGFTGTLYGMNADTAVFTALAGTVDILGVTYYPLNNDFTVKDSAVVSSDISTFVGNYSATGKPIYMQEAGYQTGGTFCNSSESKQAQFVQNIFDAWDTHNASIKAVSFLRLNDVDNSSAIATATQYGLVGNSGFIEYIQTLGFFNYDGTEKQAFEILSDNAHARGW